MTLSGVRDFFRTELDTLGFREWTDPFVIDNIPATILDGAYHLDIGNIRISNIGVQAKAYSFSYPVTLKVLSKGFRNPSVAIDAALDNAEDIIEALLGATIDNHGLKQINPTALTTQPLQLSNEHAVILVMSFSAELILSFG